MTTDFSADKIKRALFTANQLATIAQVDPKLVFVWLDRGLLHPAKLERLTVRSRPLFSVVEIFEVRLAKVLSNSFGITASEALGAGSAGEKQAEAKATVQSRDRELVRTLADEGWM